MKKRTTGFLEKLILKLKAPNLKKKANFFRLLAVSQNAGLGVRDALISIKRSEKHEGLRIIIADLVDRISEGESLSLAMANHDYLFNTDETELIKSAETMGNMPEVLGQVADELENYEQIKQKIKKAMTYPIVLIGFTVVAIVILLIYVIPTIVGMFPPEIALPRVTQFMLDASGFLQKAWFLIVIFIIGIIVLYKFLYGYVLAFKVLIDKFMISMPVVKDVVKTFYMYRYSKLLAQFYQAGVSPVISLKLISDIFTNFHYKKKALDIRRDLVAGFTFSESMEGSSLFDPILVQIIHVGEDTGNMGEILFRISKFYNKLLENKIEVLMSFMEPFLMAFIAIVIGVIVGSIFLPMAEMVNVIQ